MFIRCVKPLNRESRKLSYVYLAIISCCGTILGVLSAKRVDPVSFGLISTAVCKQAPFADSFLVFSLPYLLTAIFAYLGKAFLFLPLVFLKALTYAFIYSSVNSCFYHAGWLIAGLFLLSDTISLIVLFWFWVRHIDGIRATVVSDFLLSLSVSLFALLAQLIFISPFLSKLMHI